MTVDPVILFFIQMSKTKQFQSFVKDFHLNLEFIFNKNPYLTVFIVNFKSQNWYKGDKTTASGSNLEIMVFHYRLLK